MKYFTLAVASLLFLTSESFAKPGKGKGEEHNGKSTEIKFSKSLIPSDVALTDLATSAGEVRYRLKKKNGQAKIRISIPAAAPSLGIADDATAALADIHVEILRAGVAIADCSLKLASIDDSEPAQNYRFRLHAILKKSSKLVKGSCAAALPTLAADDQFKVYGNVAGLRKDFLINQ